MANPDRGPSRRGFLAMFVPGAGSADEQVTLTHSFAGPPPLTRRQMLKLSGAVAAGAVLFGPGCTGQPAAREAAPVPELLSVKDVIPPEIRNPAVAAWYQEVRGNAELLAQSSSVDLVRLANFLEPVYDQFRRDEQAMDESPEPSLTEAAMANFLCLIRLMDIAGQVLENQEEAIDCSPIWADLQVMITSSVGRAVADHFIAIEREDQQLNDRQAQDIEDYRNINGAAFAQPATLRSNEEIVALADELALRDEPETFRTYARSFNLRREVLLWWYTVKHQGDYRQYTGRLGRAYLQYIQADDIPNPDAFESMANFVRNFGQWFQERDNWEAEEGSWEHFIKHVFTYQDFLDQYSKTGEKGSGTEEEAFAQIMPQIRDRRIVELVADFIFQAGQKFGQHLPTGPFSREQAIKSARQVLSNMFWFRRPDKVEILGKNEQVLKTYTPDMMENGNLPDADIIGDVHRVQIHLGRFGLDFANNWDKKYRPKIEIDPIFGTNKEGFRVKRVTFFARAKEGKGVEIRPGVVVVDKEGEEYFLWNEAGEDVDITRNFVRLTREELLEEGFYAEVGQAFPEGAYSGFDFTSLDEELAQLLGGGFTGILGDVSQAPDDTHLGIFFESLQPLNAHVAASLVLLPPEQWFKDPNQPIESVPVHVLTNAYLGGKAGVLNAFHDSGWKDRGSIGVMLSRGLALPLLTKQYDFVGTITDAQGKKWWLVGAKAVAEENPSRTLIDILLQKAGGDRQLTEQTIAFALPADDPRVHLNRSEGFFAEAWHNRLAPDLCRIAGSFIVPMGLGGLLQYLPPGAGWVLGSYFKYGLPEWQAWFAQQTLMQK